MIRTTNDVMCSLLFQDSLLARYWAESLHAVTYLLNLLPTKAISAPSHHFALFGTTPSYAHLQVFGCTCYPNTSATAHEQLIRVPTRRLRRVILPFCLLRHTSRRLELPLLVQSCGLLDCSTLPLFYCRYFGDCRRAMRGTSVAVRVFVRSTRGPGFTLHPAPLGVPAMTSDPHAGALPRRVIGLSPCCHGS
jgi:hypothetical protein